MTFLKTSVLFVILFSSSLAKLSCDVDEIEVNCPSDCPDDYCPKDEFQDNIICSKPPICPPPACKCRFNHRRAYNGTCIPTRDCPQITCSRQNEVYESCPPNCPSDDCRDASPSGKCDLAILLVRICYPTCRCIKGYWRKDGICVPYEECPPKGMIQIIPLFQEKK